MNARSQDRNSLSYQHLPGLFYSEVEPSPVSESRLFALNTDHGQALGLSEDWLRSKDGLAVLSGQRAIGETPALAMAYAGHQFGHWSGMLGDGRARLVADLADSEGDLHEFHLKGSGLTPYSRRGDGKATLGSAIREYIVSEAMAALGVPTTRALSIVATGDKIHRHGLEPTAILCRTARSHIRVGTFQLALASGEPDNVKALADLAIERLYPEAPNAGPERYIFFFQSVVRRQARLVAKWMGFGFIHGVMNTDNMCVSGETIDYGPCAFMDDFHPGKVFSSIDRNGRYAWNRQAEMAHWNLARLAETLLPLFGETEEAQQAAAESTLNQFITLFQGNFNAAMAAKFGLDPDDELDGFLGESFKAMTRGEVDFTLFFRNLTRVATGGDADLVINLFIDADPAQDWFDNWAAISGYKSGLSNGRIMGMKHSNPVIIPRNHRVEQAIEDANAGNSETYERLLDAVTKPYLDRPDFIEFETPPEPNEIVHQTFCGT